MGAVSAANIRRHRWIIPLAILGTILLIAGWHHEKVKTIYDTYATGNELDSEKQPTTLKQAPNVNLNKTESVLPSLEEVLARQPPPPANFDGRNDTFDLQLPSEFDPAGPRPDQFIILTAADGGDRETRRHGDIPNMLELALQNRQEYCDIWGYTCHWVNTTRYDVSPYGAHHKKAPAIVETFQTYPDAQWIWILDEDAIIMNPAIDQRERLVSHEGMRKTLLANEPIKKTQYFTPNETDPNEIDVIIAQEGGMMNSGSILFRRSDSCRWIMDSWRSDSLRDKSMSSDQRALIRVMDESILARSHLGIVQFRLLQSWAVGSPIMGFQPGDLIIHFAGCWVKNYCKSNWDKYWAKKEQIWAKKEEWWAKHPEVLKSEPTGEESSWWSSWKGESDTA